MLENYQINRIQRPSETKLLPKRITKLALLIFAFLAFSFTTYAQPGAIDPTFNPTDVGFGLGDGADNSILSTAIQSDGKIIIGGKFTSYNGKASKYIARLNADGTLDTSFNPSGAGADDWILSVAIQSDGKIIIGGNFTSYNGTARNRIARLNADGTLDATFNPSGAGASNAVLSIALQGDGKIIIGGYFTSYNGTARNRTARLNTNGTLDTTFNPGVGPNNNINFISIQSDGKIIIGGWFNAYNGATMNHIARLNTDGTLDLTFNPSGAGAENSVLSIVQQSDGKIIIGGEFTTYNGTARNRIARLNADGTLDTSFNPGVGASYTVFFVGIRNDGKIIIGGEFTTYNGTARNCIACLNADGTLDTSFNPGAGANNTVKSVAIQSDGKIVIGGNFTGYNGKASPYFALLNTDGTMIQPVNEPTGANKTISANALQSDGKIIIGGLFTSYNCTARNYITRLNADGTLDSSFDQGAGTNMSVSSLAIQSDGKIIIGGEFTTYNGTARKRIARLNADGTLDTSFNPGAGANNNVNSIVLQSDGKIIIGGSFSSYNGTVRNNIARLNADGTLDTSFDPGAGPNSAVNSIALQSDGQIIIGGWFTTYNGTPRNYIARLNTNGTLDTSFNSGSGANNLVYSIAVQSDGKIIIGGSFNTYNGTARNHIACLNADGTLDTSFNPGAGANIDVSSIVLQSDGKTIIGGWFTSYNGTARNRIARLNADGTLDTSFKTGAGANSTVSSIALQNDGNIIIVGGFTSYNGTGRNRVARIKGGECETASVASSTPSVLISTPITTITHTTTGASGIGAAINLPSGVTANWGAGTISISGTPSVLGVFNYSIPLIGECGTIATGTITVLPDAPIGINGTYTYDGSVKTASATPAANTSVVWYAAATGSTLATAPSNKNMGVYKSYAASKHLSSGVESVARTLVTLTINAQPITVTVNAGQNKVYGAADPTYTYTPSTSLVSGDSFSGSLTRDAGENVGTYAITQGSLALSSNYNMSFAGDNFEVTTKPITVTVDAGQNKVYGAADPTYTYTPSTALVSGDSFSGSLTRIAGENVGSYAITQGSLALSTNYNMSFVGDNFSITKATPTIITWPTANGITYGEALSTATLSGGSASTVGSFDYKNGTSTPNAGAGSYAVEFTPADATNFNTVAGNVSVAVAKATLTTTAEDKIKKVGEINPTFTVTTTGFVLGDNESVLSVVPQANCLADESSPAGEYEITVSGGSSANYNFNYVFGKLNIESATNIESNDQITSAVWPNPTQGKLFISTNLVGKPYNVFDLGGSLVLSGSSIEAMIDLIDLKPSVYMVNIDGTIFKVVKK